MSTSAAAPEEKILRQTASSRAVAERCFANARDTSAPQRNARRRLFGELSAVVVVKIALLALAGFFLFGSDSRVPVNATTLAQHLFSQNPPSETR